MENQRSQETEGGANENHTNSLRRLIIAANDEVEDKKRQKQKDLIEFIGFVKYQKSMQIYSDVLRFNPDAVFTWRREIK